MSENNTSEMNEEELKADVAQSSQPLLQVFVLGPLRLEWQVAPLTQEALWSARTSARALFLLLLFAPDRQASRSQLAGILWPETEERNALESLRSALKVLRKVLSTAEGEVLIETPKSDLLKLADQSRLWIDMDAFETLIERANKQPEMLFLWQQASTYWQGELLTEEKRHEWFAHPWIKVRRKRLHAARRRMIRHLTQGYLLAGQRAQAEEVLSKHIAAFPTDQDALYLLMKLLIEEGCFDEARSHYEQCQRALARYEKQPAKHLQALEAHLDTMATKAFAQTKYMATQKSGHVVESNLFFSLVSSPRSEEEQHPLEDLAQWISETLQQTGEHNQLMEAKRRETIKKLLGLAGVAATPFAWWEYQKDSKQSLMTESDFQYGQQMIEGGWGLCNVGEWQTAHYVLESILPDALRAARKQPEAALLAARGLVLQSILQVHQLNVTAMIPLCQQAVLYAKHAGDHTTICAALNGLAVSFKYNHLLDNSFQAYLEAVSYCDERATPLVKSRIYAGLAASFAQRGYKREADLYINLAYEHFPEHPEHDPHFLSADHGLYMIAYYQGLMYLSLHQPQEAWNAFESYKQSLPLSAVPMRNQLEIVNHQSRAAIFSNNLDQYIACLQEGIQGALTLKSKKRLNEIVTIFREEVPEDWQRHSHVTPLLERYPLLLEDK